MNPIPHVRDFEFTQRLFASWSPWNQNVCEAAVIAESDQFAETAHRSLTDIRTDKNKAGLWVNHEDYTFPIYRVSNSNRTRLTDVEIRSYRGEQWTPHTIQWYRQNDRYFARGIPIPHSAVRPSAPSGIDSDGALILYNPDTMESYDFWQATTPAGGAGVTGEGVIAAGAIAWFRTDADDQSPGCQLPACDARNPGSLPRNSARATGLPYLGGLLLPEDIAHECIQHALTFALPRLRHRACSDQCDLPDYVYPASNTETSNFSSNPFTLAAGMRIRLTKTIVDDVGAEIDESAHQVSPITKVFLRALREYGAFLVDGAEGFPIAAEDSNTGNLRITDAKLSDLCGLARAKIESKLNDGMTKWQIALETLNEQLSWIMSPNDEHIPFAAVKIDGSLRPNFEVVESLPIPDVNWLRHWNPE